MTKPTLENEHQVIDFDKTIEHSRQIAGKKPPLTRLTQIGIETEKDKKIKEIEIDKIFLSSKIFKLVCKFCIFG